MKIIEGGVCAAKGFKAGSVRCGVKESRTNEDVYKRQVPVRNKQETVPRQHSVCCGSGKIKMLSLMCPFNLCGICGFLFLTAIISDY